MNRHCRRDNKQAQRDAIIAAARSLFVDNGFESTAMSRVVAAAGVATNTLYSHFRDKNDVLAAVLEAELSEGLDEYMSKVFTSIGERVLWLSGRLERVDQLISSASARMGISETLRSINERFRITSRGMLRLELIGQGVSADRVDPLVNICMSTVQGLLSHSLSPAQGRQVCDALVPSLPRRGSHREADIVPMQPFASGAALLSVG